MSEKMRLRAIRYDCDFRKNELTLLEEFRRGGRYPGDLKPGECFLFVSSQENQLIWYFRGGALDVATQQHKELRVVDSRRWRLSVRTPWSPLMLQEYARSVGIVLTGIRSFQEMYRAQRQKAAERLRLARADRAERQAPAHDAAPMAAAGPL